MSLQANPVKYLNQITEDLRMDKESRSATWNWKPATRHGLSSCRELFRHEEKSSLRLGFKFKNLCQQLLSPTPPPKKGGDEKVVSRSAFPSPGAPSVPNGFGVGTRSHRQSPSASLVSARNAGSVRCCKS